MRSGRVSRGSLDDMRAFARVATLRSFTKAAVDLGVSTSALSHTVRRLENELSVRLLQRNSRSVAPTAAGRGLLEVLERTLPEIELSVAQLGRDGNRISGSVRITATRESYDAVLRPALKTFGDRYPGASIEIMFDSQFQDIIEGGFDAGIRLGEQIEQDMIALKLGPDMRMAVVASPDYTPRSAVRDPEDLVNERCIGYRVRNGGPLLPWTFAQGGRQLQVRIEAALVVNEMSAAVDAALHGFGIAYALQSSVAPFVKSGRLSLLLEGWTPSFPGFFLYHPSRRQTPPVLAALIDVLREQRPLQLS